MELLTPDEIKNNAKSFWKENKKLEAVKLIMKLGYLLKDAKSYCENNFDREPSTQEEILDEIIGIAVKANLYHRLNQMDDFREEMKKFENFTITRN